MPIAKGTSPFERLGQKDVSSAEDTSKYVVQNLAVVVAGLHESQVTRRKSQTQKIEIEKHAEIQPRVLLVFPMLGPQSRCEAASNLGRLNLRPLLLPYLVAPPPPPPPPSPPPHAVGTVGQSESSSQSSHGKSQEASTCIKAHRSANRRESHPTYDGNKQTLLSSAFGFVWCLGLFNL
ncbi:hypothetical protein EAI_14086 [Harpegnathos saltator]|uniref:Uncharacterized protein n=1 Tax=Harpegnathos saltator TaxID=610380 RepID=E2BQV1_HARSA|nr:hypothetical protein EAI_14086 [Harpegnathos saltator]